MALRARHRPSTSPPWARKAGALLLLLVRRDFINLVALAVAFVDGYFAHLPASCSPAACVAAAVVIPEHLKLRRLLREVARRGATPRLVT